MRHETGPSKRIADAIFKCREERDMSECMIAGVFYRSGSAEDHVPIDWIEAASFLEPACAADLPEACTVLIQMLEAGLYGVTRDLPRAAAIAERMCAQGWDLCRPATVTEPRDPCGGDE